VPSPSGDRSVHFPAIERKYGRPIGEWFDELAALGDATYAVQLAFLQERHGFSRAHANAVVMTARGSRSSRRFADPEAFFRSIVGAREDLARRIIATIVAAFPDLELVIAWNQPMFRLGKDYVFGLSASTQHLSIAVVDVDAVAVLGERLAGLSTTKKMIRIPLDWTVDAALLRDLVGARIALLAAAHTAAATVRPGE